jgi:2-oxoglutarate ferredoxin oxidoreductase subunit delta
VYVVTIRSWCTGCSDCVEVCPVGGLAIGLIHGEDGVERKIAQYMEQDEGCRGCDSCSVVCPEGCITITKVED